MSSATLTSPPTTARLVVDTDVASFVFKWHPKFAPLYVNVVRGFDLVVSFMTVAEMRQGAPNEPGGRLDRSYRAGVVRAPCFGGAMITSQLTA